MVLPVYAWSAKPACGLEMTTGQTSVPLQPNAGTSKVLPRGLELVLVFLPA